MARVTFSVVAFFLVAITVAEVWTDGRDQYDDEPTGLGHQTVRGTANLLSTRIDANPPCGVEVSEAFRKTYDPREAIRQQPKHLPQKPELPHVEPTGLRATNLRREPRRVTRTLRLISATVNDRLTLLPIQLRRACGQAILAGRIR